MPDLTPEADRLAALSDAELIEETARTPGSPRPLREALHSAQHHQREAVAFLAHGDYAMGHAHAAVALSAGLLGLLKYLADEDDA